MLGKIVGVHATHSKVHVIIVAPAYAVERVGMTTAKVAMDRSEAMGTTLAFL